MTNKTKDIIKRPQLLFLTLGHREWFNWMSDEQYLKIAFWARMGKWPNIDHPKSFSEKLQWIKLHDRNPLYTKLVDKYEVKPLVAEKIGDEYIIPTIGVWDNVDQIDFDLLPNQFVLKCTHDSGGLVICKEKCKLDRNAAKKKLAACLKHSFYWGMREWPYKNVKPRVIAEQYMEDETGELRDYKFFCFNGTAKCLFVATDRPNDTKFDFFDLGWNHLPIINGHPNNPNPIPRPQNFEKMVEIAEKLSSGIPHVRVDLYNIGGKIYFGELTFFHWSGMTRIEPLEWDYKLGEMLILPQTES